MIYEEIDLALVVHRQEQELCRLVHVGALFRGLRRVCHVVGH